jgi:hypothetical protein
MLSAGFEPCHERRVGAEWLWFKSRSPHRMAEHSEAMEKANGERREP